MRDRGLHDQQQSGAPSPLNLLYPGAFTMVPSKGGDETKWQPSERYLDRAVRVLDPAFGQ